MVKSMYAGFPAAEDISIICRINDSIHTHDSIFHSPYHIISAIQTRICHTNRCSRADRRIRRGNEMGEQTTDGALLDRTKDEFDPKRNESFNSMNSRVHRWFNHPRKNSNNDTGSVSSLILPSTTSSLYRSPVAEAACNMPSIDTVEPSLR